MAEEDSKAGKWSATPLFPSSELERLAYHQKRLANLITDLGKDGYGERHEVVMYLNAALFALVRLRRGVAQTSPATDKV